MYAWAACDHWSINAAMSCSVISVDVIGVLHPPSTMADHRAYDCRATVNRGARAGEERERPVPDRIVSIRTRPDALGGPCRSPRWDHVADTAVRPARHRSADHLRSVRPLGPGGSR